MEQLPHYKEEIDFRDLLRKPRRLFGFSFLYFLGLLVIVGILYAWNLNDIGKNTVVPLVLTDSSAFVQDIPLQAPGILPPLDVDSVAKPNRELLARGRVLFKANCVSCHGENGMGDGPAVIVLNPRPRNLHQATGWTNGAKVSEIYRTLEEGIVRNGMASYNYLSPADRFALIHVVRSFNPSPPADTDQEIAALDTTYQLSKGKSIPAQIPVKVAMNRIVTEAGQGREVLLSRIKQIRVSQDPGAVLFSRYVHDPVRFLTACESRPGMVNFLEDFVRLVSIDPVALGVVPAVTNLAARDWAVLHHFVLLEVR